VAAPRGGCTGPSRNVDNLKNLQALMDDPKPTGDAKKDAIVARERKQAMSQARAKQKPRKGKKR
jgi:hypothetical protein